MKRPVLVLVAAAYASLAAAQSAPAPFTFAERSGVATNALVTSEARTVTGFAGALDVRISGEGNPQYRVGAGVFTSAPGTILAGQALTVRHTSSTHAATATVSTVTVGDYATPFKSVTGATDRTPDPFDFGTRLNTFPSSFVESAPQVLADFNTPVAIQPGPNAQYRIEAGAWTNAAGTLNPGQALAMRHLTSTAPLAYTQTYLTVGGIRGTFTTRNRGPNQAPIADAGADQRVDENAAVTLDGRASADAEGALAYAWTQTAGTPVELAGADTATPAFTAPPVDAEEMLRFALTVTDDEGASASDTVEVVVLDLPDLAIADAELQEDAGSMEFVVTISPAATREIAVDFATADGSADASDYSASSGRLVIPAGAETALIVVPIAGDAVDEPDETFTLGLANAAGAEITNGLATGTIRDDDEPADDSELATAAAETTARGCDFLDPSNCLYPFPNDFFTVAAAPGSPQSAEQGGTGRRVNFNVLAMPRNTAGRPVDPAEWNRNDGFSPGALITTHVPNLSLEQTFGLPSHEIGVANLALSQDPQSPILVLEVDDSLLAGLFGEPSRHLVWAELDQNANLLTVVGAPNVGTQAIPGVTDERGHVARPNNDGKAALLIRPAKNFAEGKRYVVVLRNLKDAAGNAIEPQAGFRACAAGASALPPVQQRCALLEQNVFPVLEDAGVALGDVYVAWDFTVQSTNNAIGRLRHMRDDAFASLSRDPAGEDCTQLTADNAATCAPPAFQVTHVTENPQGGIARRIEGTITVPSYLVPFEPAPADDAAVSGAIHTLCGNASELEGDCRGDFRDAADLAQGVTAPNRLFFRPGDGATHTDATQLPYGDGLPDSTGSMQARFLCQIPAQATPDAPARASLYGHGQLDRGVAITYEGVPDQAREHNYMFCAVDWFGFRTGDAVNVLSTLADLSNFAVVPDASQQGMLNFMFLARAMAHPQGFGALPEFQDAASGRPLFDRSEIFYDGNSQGGIFGGVVLAASKDVNRGVLGALGMNYSTLLTRSANFDEYAGVLYNAYTDPLDRQLLFSMIQMLWDRSENDGYAAHLHDNSAFGGPANAAMLAPAFGDPQVSMWTADNMARTMATANHVVPFDMQQTLHVESLGTEAPGANGRRHPDVLPYYGLRAMDYSGADVYGSVLQVWDNAQLKGKYAFVPPTTNTPPYATKEGDRDPHDTSQRTPDGRCVHAHFMRTGGQVIDAMPLVYGSASCPPIPPAAPTLAPGDEQPLGFVAQIVAAIDSVLGPSLQALADALASAATQLGELAGIALDPPGPGAAPQLPAPEPLLAGAAKRPILVPVGTPLGGYLRPPVGGEYIGDDPAGEITDNVPSANDGCDPTEPASCIPNAPLADEARKAHSPYATFSPPSRGYYDSLIAKAVALYDGHDYVVLVKTDFIGMLDEVVQDVKADVKARTGVDLGDGLIMSATHSHDGPGALANHSTRYFWLAMDAYQHDVYRRLVGQLADVVIAALDDLRPARIGHGNGLEAPETGNGNGINGYRRGRLDTYDDDDAPGCAFVPAERCPAGIDDANELRKRIGILRVDDAATGAPIAVVVNFAEHGIAFDVENQYFSGDVLGAIEREVEQSYAQPAGDDSFRAPIAMLVQNTGGDVTPKNVDYSIRGIEALGKRMAPQVRAVADGIAQFQDQPDLRAVSQRVILSRERLGYADDEYPYPWGAAQCGNDLAVPFADVGVNDIPGYDQTGLPRKHLYCIPATAPDAADLADNGVAENGAFVPGDTILSAAKIGAITLIVQPGEPLTEYGVRSLEMAQAEGFAPPDTFIWGYAADHIGYILPPVREDWATFGGAESTTTFWGWKQGQRFIDGHRELLRALRDGAAPPADEFRLDYSLGKQMVANVPAAQPTPSLLPGQIVAQPTGIARFGSTQFVFEGGDPVIDLPRVVMLHADGTPVRRANGEVIDTFFEMHLKYRLVSGRHLWTVEFEAPKDWALGSYRFAVQGKAFQGGEVAYQLESTDFAVTPARDLQAQGLACAEGRCTVSVSYRAVPLNYRNVDPLVRENDAAPVRTGEVTFSNGVDTVVVPADGTGAFAAMLGGNVTVSAVDAWGNTTPVGGGGDPDADGDGVPDASDQCPDTPAGTTVDANGCPVEEGEGFPYHCDTFFGSGYCIEDIPGVGAPLGEALDTAWNALNGGGGEPPPGAAGESLVSCAVNQDPGACQAALDSLGGLQDCSFDESGINCAYEVVHDAIGVDTAADYLHGLFAQCATTPAAPACAAIRSTADGSDLVSVPVLSRPIPRGDLVYAEVPAATPSTKTVDGAIDDWMAQGTHIGGTDLYEFGEHVYSDFLFDAFGADSGDDAQRWAALSLAGEFSSRTERVDALQQAGGDQLDVPPPGGTTSDHYGDRASREDGTDLTEVRWAADGDDLYFLARVARLQDPANLAILILADTDAAASGMAGLNAGLTTAIFDRAVVLRAGGGELRDTTLAGGAGGPGVAIVTAVSAAGDDNALEARIPRALLERADGTIRVAVMTVRDTGADLAPANVAYRFDEPVTIYSERAQALSLFAGSIDHFTRQIAVADLAGGRTQAARPGPGYHERQFLSGANISNEADPENGRLQPYGVYVPSAPAVNTLNQARMTIWTHYRGGKAHSGAAWTPRLFWQLGEEQGNIVVSPRARGTSTWYTTRAHQDFFEVFADAAGTDLLGQYADQNLPAGHPFGRDGLFFVDPARIYISGYSMGGYATFLFTGLYPDLFAGGFSQSGAVTQGAWTGIGPDAGDPGYDQACGFRAPDDFPEVGGGTACFIEANSGRANAQLNYRLLENTLHVPITIHHGSNDELALTPGAARMGARLAELQYRYDATTFLGYEHFTQAIMDEWRDGAVYLNRHERPANPRAVTYKVVPALVKAVNEVQPQGSSGGFDFHPDGAYWVDDLVVRDGGDGAIPEGAPVPFGRIDAESRRLAGITYVPVPRTGAEADTSAPYASTNVVSPANHSTPFVRHSLEWLQTGELAPDANAFTVTLANLSHASLDLARMGFGGHFDAPITGDVASDGAVVLTLKNVGADMTVCVDGAPQGEVLADSDVGVALEGDATVLLVPGLGASCSAGPVTPPAPSVPELVVGNAATTAADVGAQIQGYLAGLVGSPATAPAQLEAAAGDVMNQVGVLRTANAWLRRPPLNISHRGGENDWPENTMFAYAESIRAAGSDMIEMDIYETADGELVVIHDDTVDRTTDGSGSVSGMTLAQLKALDAAHWFAQDGDTRYGTSSGRDEAFYVYRGIATGARPVPAGLAALGYTANDFRIPTLREIFENPSFANVLINIELKPDPDSTGQYEAKLAAMIRAYGRGDDVIVASFLDHNSTLFKANAPEIGTSVPTAQVALAKASGNPPFAPEGLNPANGITAAHVAFQVPVDFSGLPVITGEFVADAHARGIAVQAWTINDRATMIDLLNKCVDGIMSDKPMLLEEVLNSGEWSCALDP